MLYHVIPKGFLSHVIYHVTVSCMFFANEICKQVPDSLAHELFFVLSALSQKYF